MAVETGTATDYLDLLAKLKTFLTTNADLVAASQEWICNRDDGSDMLFQGPGLSGTEEIFIGMEPYENVGSDLYSWDIVAFTGYVPGNSFDTQPGRVTTNDTFLPLWNSSIPYWFIGNGQRIIVVAKVNTTYQTMYLGKFNAFGTPNQYPYPVIQGGMTGYYLDKYSSTSTSLRFFPCGPASQAFIYLPSGGVSKNDTQAVGPGANDFVIHPFALIATTTSILGKVDAFTSGDVTLLPATIVYGTPTGDHAILGELDGIFWIHGTGQSSETIVTINTVDYLVFQDGAKNDRNNFAAVRLA